MPRKYSFMKFVFLLSLWIKIGFSITVSRTQYHFTFKDKIHENWILSTYEDYHMLTCSRKCLNNAECDGLALGPLEETLDTHRRTCYLLANVIEEDCDEEYDCSKEGVQVYLVSYFIFSIYVGTSNSLQSNILLTQIKKTVIMLSLI